MEIQLKKGRNIQFNHDHILIIKIKNDQWDHPVLPSYICYDGYIGWFKNGNHHRIDKPALIYSNGVKRYWENGTFIKEEI